MLVVALTQDMTTAVITAVVLLIPQQVDANIIQPRLMSGSFSLSPLLVIISITIVGSFFGVIGMIAAIPIVAVAKGMLLIVYRESSKAAKEDKTKPPGP